MDQRSNYYALAPEGIKAMLGLEKYIHGTALEPNLIHLIKLRVSQLNGCAYCIDMHWKDLRALGETEQRLYSLDAWRESSYYTDRERAAFAWAESLTFITNGHVPDSVYAAAREQFAEKDLVDLALVTTTINAWNRVAIAFRAKAGPYQSPLRT